MNFTYLSVITLLTLAFYTAHFLAVRKCNVVDWWRVILGFSAFCCVMMFVSMIPAFDVEIISQNQHYGLSLFRSIIEESTKVFVCYIVFETISSARIKYATLAFCSLIALFESAEPIIYFTQILIKSFFSLFNIEPLEASIMSLYALESQVGIIEAILLFSFETIRIYVHFLLTYSGVYFLMTLKKRWCFLIPLLIHGLTNQALLFVSGSASEATTIGLLRIIVALITVFILILLFKLSTPFERLKLEARLAQ